MSNYLFTCWDKKTGKKFDGAAYDDYYGRHRYGYEVGGVIFNEDEFSAKFTINEV